MFYGIGDIIKYRGDLLEIMEGKGNTGDCVKCSIFKSCRPPIRCFLDDVNCKKPIYYKLIEQCKPKDMEQENNESKKNDRLDDKLRWELLPLEDIEDIVKVYTAGAKKYGPNTWQNLPDGYNRYKAAFFRHLLEHEKGNWLDEETGSIHLAQCVWNAIAMLHIAKQNMKNNENTICSKEENLLTERKDTSEK